MLFINLAFQQIDFLIFFYNQLWFEATCYCMRVINFTLFPQFENVIFLIMLIVPWIVGKSQNSLK